MTSARTLVIEKNSTRAKHAVSLAIVTGQIESCNLADAIRITGMEGCRLSLGHLMSLSEHFTRTGEIELAVGLLFLQRCQYVMRSIDVRVHRRKPIRKTFSDKALRSEVVTLIELVTAQDMKNAGITLEIRGMQNQLIQQMSNSAKSLLRRLESHSSNQTMDLIVQAEQVFGEITTILSGDACD